MCTRHMDVGGEIAVLHVDDEPTVGETVAALLEREDDRFTVDTATSAEAALELLDDRAIDCVVSDYDMPGRNGIEFLEAVREEYPELPFVLYTGKGSEEVASDAVSAGVTDYLQKGTDPSQYTVLANRVRNAVATYRSNQRADTMHRIQQVLRDVNRNLVRAESRPEIESATCAVLGDVEPYSLVWFGTLQGDSLLPRERAGEASAALETIVEAADGDDPSREALERRESVVRGALPEESDPDSWVGRAREHGIQSVVAVPILHDGVCYGVLTVCSERLGFFDERERDLLTELGEDVGHAIYRVENEQRLREQRADLRLYERAVESSSDLLAGIDDDYTLVFANERYREFHGIDEDDIGELSLPDVLGETWDEVIKEREDRVLEGEVLSYEVERTAPDGDRRTFSVRDYPLRDNDGTILGVVGAMRDITGRTVEQRERRAVNERLDLAVAAADIGVWDWDVRTDEVQFDEQWAAMLGHEPTEIDPHLDAWERRVHPAERPSVREALETHLAGETDHYEAEYRMRTADGSWKWIRGIGRVTRRDDDGEPRRMVGVHLDVDDRKREDR